MVSILCVTRNRREFLLRCLDSCARQDYSKLEFIVIDNASTDGTVNAVTEAFPNAKLIRTHRNIGFFPALNLAIANASGNLLMTVDDDAYFKQNDALSKMVDAFASEPGIGGATCNIEGPYEAPPTHEDRYVHSFKTGFAMLPREVFTEWVGFYPDVFFRSGGEQYISTALWDEGRPFKQLAHVWMYHAQTPKGRSSWDCAFFGYRSQILVSLMRDPWFIIPLRLVSKLLRSIWHTLRRRHLLEFVACLAAWCNVLLYIPYALRLRKPITLKTRRRLRQLARAASAK